MTRQRKVILGATGVPIALITVIAFLRVHDQVASSTLGRLRVELPAKQVRAVVASLGSAARRQPAQPAPTSTVNAPPAPQQGASNRELAEQWLTAVVTYREPDRGDVLNKLDQALVERGASMVGALARISPNSARLPNDRARGDLPRARQIGLHARSSLGRRKLPKRWAVIHRVANDELALPNLLAPDPSSPISDSDASPVSAKPSSTRGDSSSRAASCYRPHCPIN